MSDDRKELLLHLPTTTAPSFVSQEIISVLEDILEYPTEDKKKKQKNSRVKYHLN